MKMRPRLRKQYSCGEKETIYLREQNFKRPYGVQVDFHLITH